MKKTHIIAILTMIISIILTGCQSQRVEIELKKDYAIDTVPLKSVKVENGFWGKRLEINREVTIPHVFKQCEQKGRIDNFAIAGGLIKGQPKGNFPFDDTDVYKSIEAASYSLINQQDSKLEKYLDEIIKKIAAAQEKDFGLKVENRCPNNF